MLRQNLGNYKITHKIGAGGQGTVYEAPTLRGEPSGKPKAHRRVLRHSRAWSRPSAHSLDPSADADGADYPSLLYCPCSPRSGTRPGRNA